MPGRASTRVRKNKLTNSLLLLICLMGSGLVSSQPIRYNLEEKRWLNQHPALRVGVVEQDPPVLFFAGGSNPQGLVADYLRALVLHLGLQLEIERYTDGKALADALRQGEVDAVGAWPAGWRPLESVSLSRPYLSLPVALYGNSDIPSTGLSGLRKKTLGVITGSVWERLAQIAPGQKVASYPTLELALQAAADGAVYAYIGDAASTDYLLKRKSFGDLEIQYQLDLTYDLTMATRVGDSALSSLLQKGLDRIGADELQEIWNRWPGAGKPQQFAKETPSLLLWFPLFLAWSALLVWGVYRYLARKEHLRHTRLTQLIQRFQRRERRLKEKLLALKKKALDYRSESHPSRQRLIDEVMPNAAWIWEPAAEECQWDDRMYTLYQQDPDRFKPTPEAILGLVHAEDREQVAALFRQPEGNAETHLSYRLALPDGNIRWLLDFSYFSADQAEGAEQRIGLCWDVTDYLCMPQVKPSAPSVES